MNTSPFRVTYFPRISDERNFFKKKFWMLIGGKKGLFRIDPEKKAHTHMATLCCWGMG